MTATGERVAQHGVVGCLAITAPASRAGAGVAWVELGGAEAQQALAGGRGGVALCRRFERERGIALDHADLTQQALRLRVVRRSLATWRALLGERRGA